MNKAAEACTAKRIVAQSTLNGDCKPRCECGGQITLKGDLLHCDKCDYSAAIKVFVP